MKNVKLSQKLTESGLMLALTTILSIFAIAKLPYGGEITLASMLPMIIISYRYGFRWGMLTGAAYGIIQMLLGLKNVSYATSALAAIAIIVLDYMLAFMSVSIGAAFRRMKSQRTALIYAALAVCAARYLFHVISGCTVWAGLSIPTADALIYSLIYNATYMLPETIVTCVAAGYLGSSLDFGTPRLSAVKAEGYPAIARVLSAEAGFVLMGAVAAVMAIIFPCLQNAETGEFYIEGIFDANLTAVGIICGVSAAVMIMLLLDRWYVIRESREKI